MRKPNKIVETTFFLQLEPEWSPWTNSDGGKDLRGFKVTKIFQWRPKKINGVVFKLTVRLPAAAFTPLTPSATIDVPEEALHYEPTVEVDLNDRE